MVGLEGRCVQCPDVAIPLYTVGRFPEQPAPRGPAPSGERTHGSRLQNQGLAGGQRAQGTARQCLGRYRAEGKEGGTCVRDLYLFRFPKNGSGQLMHDSDMRKYFLKIPVVKAQH